MSDLDTALQPVREFLERRHAEREKGTERSASIERLLATAAALQEPAPVDGSTDSAPGPDWELYERNRAEIREIVKRLRNGSH